MTTQNPEHQTTTSEVRVDDALRHVARDALADDGIMAVRASHVMALLDERDRLREALRKIARECGRARGDQGHRDASRFAFATAYKAAGEGPTDG
jgi:hypothetical protein